MLLWRQVAERRKQWLLNEVTVSLPPDWLLLFPGVFLDRAVTRLALKVPGEGKSFFPPSPGESRSFFLFSFHSSGGADADNSGKKASEWLLCRTWPNWSSFLWIREEWKIFFPREKRGRKKKLFIHNWMSRNCEYKLIFLEGFPFKGGSRLWIIHDLLMGRNGGGKEKKCQSGGSLIPRSQRRSSLDGLGWESVQSAEVQGWK